MSPGGYVFTAVAFSCHFLSKCQDDLPHSMLEMPAVILAAAYGLWLGVTFTNRIRQRNLVGFGYQVRHAIRMFFKIAFPLFILAAFIETFLIYSMGGIPR
jgi:uncharacterized membrane protein SpoIIM required for sporulation